MRSSVDSKAIHLLNFISFDLKIITNKLNFINQSINFMATYFKIIAGSV
jgi:hypothetical protein